MRRRFGRAGQARTGLRWRVGVEMNSIDYEIANLDPAGAITSLSSLDVPSELDADWNTDIREPTVVPSIPVRGHVRRAGVIAYRLVRDTSRHRERPLDGPAARLPLRLDRALRQQAAHLQR